MGELWGIGGVVLMVKLTLIQGDCLKVLSKLPSESVDLVVTSPPYNLQKPIPSGPRALGKRKEINYNDNLMQNEYFMFLDRFISESLRVVKNYIFLNIQPLSNNKIALFKLVGKYAENIKEIIVWHKKRFQRAINKKVLSSAYEFIIVFGKNIPENRAFVFDVNKESNCWMGEPNDIFYRENFNMEGLGAVFPFWLPKKIISIFSEKGNTVLDPFLGSGTTMKACLELKRNCIGIEISPEHVSITKKRLNWGYSLGDVEFEFLTEDEFLR